jgi:RNA polymerase sigma-70 factor, ECF subfamily
MCAARVAPRRDECLSARHVTIAYDDLAHLYRRHARALLVFFQRRTHDPELATDLMADTFTTALERREQFRGSTASEQSGWLWSIAQSVLRDHERRGEAARRGAHRLGRERRALTDREIERIEELAGSAELRAAVARGLERLPDEQAAALRMRVIEGLPYAEIARRLGLTASGTRTRVTRAMRDLRRMLEREAESEEGSPW